MLITSVVFCEPGAIPGNVAAVVDIVTSRTYRPGANLTPRGYCAVGVAPGDADEDFGLSVAPFDATGLCVPALEPEGAVPSVGVFEESAPPRPAQPAADRANEAMARTLSSCTSLFM